MSSVRVLSRAVLPAAIVFDCDGLLLDTEGCWSVGETALFARHGLAFGDDHKQALIGVAMPDAGPILEELLASPGRGAELTGELVELVVAEVTRVGCTPMPGALELLAMLRGRMPLGVASNAPRPVFQAAIAAARRLGLVRRGRQRRRRRPAQAGARRLSRSVPPPRRRPRRRGRARGHRDRARRGARRRDADDRRPVGLDGGARGRPRRRVAARPDRPRLPRPDPGRVGLAPPCASS